MFGFIDVDSIIIGVVTGGGYALLAVSITLMYRSTGFLSFAHAGFATLAAYVYADLAGTRQWPGLVAAAVAIGITLVYGLIVERVLRPIRNSPAATKMIATLGVVQLSTALVLLIYGFQPTSAPLLLPEGAVTIGDLRIGHQQSATLLLAAVSAAGLGWFLKTTRFGTAIRAVASNPETARLMGVSLTQVGRFNWVLGAGLAGSAGVLLAPLSPINAGTFTLLLAKALVATLVGGLMSLPLTFAGALGIGVADSITVQNLSAPGSKELVTLLLVVALLFLRRTWPSDLEATAETKPRRPSALLGSVAPLGAAHHPGCTRCGGPPPPPPPCSSSSCPPARATGASSALAGCSSPSRLSAWCCSWGGAARSASCTAPMWGSGRSPPRSSWRTTDGVSSWPCSAAASPAWSWAQSSGCRRCACPGCSSPSRHSSSRGPPRSGCSVAPSSQVGSRGTLFGVDIFPDSNLYFFMLPATVVLYVAVWNVRRSTFGPLLISSHDAPTTVAHFGADPSRTRMWAFLFASFIAAFGGGLSGVLLTGFQPFDFSLILSIALLVYAVVGGVQTLAGQLVAGVLFGVVPTSSRGSRPRPPRRYPTSSPASWCWRCRAAPRRPGLAALPGIGGRLGATPRLALLRPVRPRRHPLARPTPRRCYRRRRTRSLDDEAAVVDTEADIDLRPRPEVLA